VPPAVESRATTDQGPPLEPLEEQQCRQSGGGADEDEVDHERPFVEWVVPPRYASRIPDPCDRNLIAP